MTNAELQHLAQTALRETEAALRDARRVATELKVAVEESDRRIEPAVKRLREAGFLRR